MSSHARSVCVLWWCVVVFFLGWDTSRGESPPPASLPSSVVNTESVQAASQGRSINPPDAKDPNNKSPDKPILDAYSLMKADGNIWPMNGPAAVPPPLPPVPNLPPGYDMGYFPPRPEKKENTGSLQEYIRENLSVKLRGAGTLRFYGNFRGDYDNATARFGIDLQNPFVVLPNDPTFRAGPNAVPIKPHNFNYALYPRLTRIGAEYYGPPIEALGGATTTGRLEVDFLTGANASINPESRELLRLRLAYITVTWDEFTLLVGQDWDLVSPLIPTVNDNTNMWNAGNLGDRRPQVKFLWDHKLGGDRVLQIQNGLILADALKNPDLEGNGLRDNEASGIPGYQGRIGWIGPSMVEGEKLICGAWTMLAIDQVNGTLPPPFLPVPGQPNPQFSQYESYRFLSRGFGLDLRLPIVEDLTFQGEVWYGQNLADFRGGVAQSVNVPRKIPIRAKGGWAELVYRVCPHYQFAIGATVDDVRDSDLIGLNQVLYPGYPEGVNVNSGVKLNYTYYLSNRFPIGNGLMFGLDYMNWNTEYVGFKAGHASLVKLFLQQAF